jgi:glutaminase
MENKQSNSVFQSIDDGGRGEISRDAIIECLSKAGVSINDSRLEKFRVRLDSLIETKIDASSFEALLGNSGSLIARAAKGELVIPEFDRFVSQVAEVFNEVGGIKDGAVADYIPQLARVSPDNFGVSISTVDGQQFSIGDSGNGFTLQSSCKPILYCAALEEHGEQKVHSHVGREPSGLSFNELTLNKSGLPHNPMINAGAIMTSSLIQRELPTADRLEYLTGLVTALSGKNECHFNNAVWHSERETADRNFALAHHMRERGAFPDGTTIRPTLDYYFSACSIEVTAENMSTIGATLANGGVCPQTGERVFAEETVKNCLSMMYSCGLYDYSGEFAFTVGIPAKSSVSGVVLAVIPNVMGIAVWSPRLDECGNSVRGVAFLKKLIERFSFHNYDSQVDSSKQDPRRIRHANETDQTYRAIYAASIGDINELKRLVAHGHNLNCADYDGRTPLHLACAEGQADAVGYLLNQKVDPTPKDRWGNTPFADATRHKRGAVKQLLLATVPKPASRPSAAARAA